MGIKNFKEVITKIRKDWNDNWMIYCMPVLSSILLSLPLIPAQRGLERERLYEQLYEQVKITPDINNDGFTSLEEWVDVYRTIGLHFDESSSNPKEDLSISQLERYLTTKNSFSR